MTNIMEERTMDLIDKFGEVIDKALTDSDVWLKIKMPSGTMEPEITSCFGDIAVMDFYIMLHALRKTMEQVMIQAPVDPDKKEQLIDGMLAMVKADLMDEEAADE
jgi:hypothetical protein